MMLTNLISHTTPQTIIAAAGWWRDPRRPQIDCGAAYLAELLAHRPTAEDADLAVVVAGDLADCPGRKPAFLVFKRPARPYKSPIQNGFS
jgi:hypothetical protein